MCEGRIKGRSSGVDGGSSAGSCRAERVPGHRAQAPASLSPEAVQHMLSPASAMEAVAQRARSTRATAQAMSILKCLVNEVYEGGVRCRLLKN